MVARLVGSNCHARRQHGLNKEAYLEKWPGAPFVSVEAGPSDRAKAKAYKKTHSKQINEHRRDRHAELVKAAAENPNGPAAALLKKEHDQQAAKWKKNYWGEGDGDKAAEAFRKSESVRRKERHAKNPEEENRQSRARYKKNLSTSRARSREKQKKLRELAKAAIAAGILVPFPHDSLKPKNPPHRPRKDDIAEKVNQLKTGGLSWNQIAVKLNSGKKQKDQRTADAYRSLWRARYSQSGLSTTPLVKSK
jgi:hypothetical protein